MEQADFEHTSAVMNWLTDAIDAFVGIGSNQLCIKTYLIETGFAYFQSYYRGITSFTLKMC